MLQFLAVFIQATDSAGLELGVFFNGSFESSRHVDWIQNQLQVRLNVNNVSIVWLFIFIKGHLPRIESTLSIEINNRNFYQYDYSDV